MSPWRRAALAAVLFVTAGTAAGQDTAPPTADPAATPVQKARAAFEAYRKAERAAIDGEAEGGEDARKLHDAKREAERRFEELFAKVPRDAWDLAADPEIVGEGAFLAGRSAWAGEDFARAREEFEFLVDRLPTCRRTDGVKADYLPPVYAALGAIDDGIARLRGFSTDLQGEAAARVLLGAGDLLAAKGSFDEARRAYGDAEAAVEEQRPSALSTLPKDFARRKLVGEPAPYPEWLEWSGAKPAGFKKRVVVLYVLRPVAASQGDTTQALEALHRKLGPLGVTVVGVTSFERTAWPLTDRNGVEVTLPADERGFPGPKARVGAWTLKKHVDVFRQRMKITFPVAVASEASLAPLAVEPGSSGIFVIDTNEVVAFAAHGTAPASAVGIARYLRTKSFGTQRGPR